MSDDADRAQAQTERELEAIIAAARGVKSPHRAHCAECGETLEAHRRPFGRCIECARARLARG